jgi:hypothetical protein
MINLNVNATHAVLTQGALEDPAQRSNRVDAGARH